MTIAATNTEKIRISLEEPKKYKLIGNVAAAHIEESETYFDIDNIIAKTKRHTSVATGFIAKNAPHPVATPFPPLKFKNMVNICPKTTASVTAITNISDDGFISAVKNTGIKPFNVSHKNAKRPNGLLKRKTFVAPGFPEPYFLISIPLKSLAIIYAKGIEPMI